MLLNGIFHSGIYTWLGAYFSQRYHLGEVGIGLALLGYGVPGFFLGPQQRGLPTPAWRYDGILLVSTLRSATRASLS